MKRIFIAFAFLVLGSARLCAGGWGAAPPTTAAQGATISGVTAWASGGSTNPSYLMAWYKDPGNVWHNLGGGALYGGGANQRMPASGYANIPSFTVSSTGTYVFQIYSSPTNSPTGTPSGNLEASQNITVSVPITRALNISAPATVNAGQAFSVPTNASTTATNGEQIGFYHMEYSTNGGASWTAVCYDVNVGTSASRTAYITAGGVGSTIVVRARIAFRGGAAGDVDYNGGAINWAGSWTAWQTPPTKYAYISVANRAPTVTISASRSTIDFGETVRATASANDPDGNLAFQGILTLFKDGSNWYRGAMCDHSTGWGSHPTTPAVVAASYSSGAVSGGSSTEWIDHQPQWTGTITYHTNAHDGIIWCSNDSAAWAASIGYAYVTVNPTTPSGNFPSRTFPTTHTLVAEDLNATFSNPYSAGVAAPTGTITYNYAVGTVLYPGIYTVTATYPGDANYRSTSVSAYFTVTNAAPTASMSIKGYSSGTTTANIGETLTITASGADTDGNLRAVNLWVATPNIGWRNIRSDSSLNGGYVQNATTDNAINSGSNVSALGPVDRTFSILLGGGTGTYQFVVRSMDATGTASASQHVDVTVSKTNQSPLTLNAAPTQNYNTVQTLSSSGGSGSGGLSYAIVGQSATGVATLSGATLTANTGTGSVDIRSTKATDADYNSIVSNTVHIDFAKAPATVTLGGLNQTYDGTAKSATAVTSPAGLSVSFSYNGSSTAPTNSGAYAVVGTIIDPNYTGSSGGTLTVNKATATIAWTAPAAITYGTALSATQLSATANVPGTFAYTPAAGTVLNAGTNQALSVTFTPSDTANYSSTTISTTISVNKATPIITWSTPASIVYGTPLSGTQLNATSNAPGTFAYAPAGGTVLNAGSQTLTATFTPTNPNNYNSASGSVLLTVLKATPTITWTSPGGITVGIALSATQLNATASVPGSFVYTPAAGTQLAVGANQTLSVAFTPTDATNYNNANGSTTINVNSKLTPTITWTPPAAITYGTALSATQLNATASVPGTFVYTPSAGTVLNAGGGQQLSVAFTPTDTVNYNSTSGSTTIAVNKATPTVSWAAPAAITYGTALSATQLNAAASVPGAFVYSPLAGTVLNAGAGQPLSVTFTPTDTANYNNAGGSTTITVNKATPTVTWAAPAAITYGTALSATQLNATPSVPGILVYTPSAGTVLNAGVGLSLSAGFTPTDTTNYSNASGSTTITVNKATPTITWADPAAITFGTPLSEIQLNATANTPGTFVYTPPSGTALNVGVGQSLSTTFTPTDISNYNTNSKSVSISVNPIATGGTVTTNGSYTIHTFASGGTFTTNARINCEYLLVGGGGGGSSGGGGAGGVLSGTGVVLSSGTYPVTVGLGGPGNAELSGTAGGSSTFNGITALGGGGGGAAGTSMINPGTGGSGGGAGRHWNPAIAPGAAGTGGQGYAGGASPGYSASLAPAGGGGGAAGPGQDGIDGVTAPPYGRSGAGGPGISSSITGTAVYYAGGGGGGSTNAVPSGVGGIGGGGNGSSIRDIAGQNGTNGLGGGGGGSFDLSANGGSGGSGIVIVRYLTPLAAPPVVTGGSVSAQVGVPFTYQIAASNIPSSYTATGLPAGLSVDATTGIISGTPTAVASSTITLSAINGFGTGSAELVLNVILRSTRLSLTMQILGDSDVVLNGRRSVGGVKSGALSSTMYFGQTWKMALTATDPNSDATKLYAQLTRPSGGQGTNPAPSAFTWTSAYYSATILFSPTTEVSWSSPPMLADEIGTWNLSAYATNAFAVPYGSVTPWTGDNYGWQTLNEPDLIVAKAVPVGTFAAKGYRTGSGSTYTVKASDLDASFENPYSTAVAAPTGAISYSIVNSNGSTTPLSVGTILNATAGFYTVRASYPGDGNYESASVDTQFAVHAGGTIDANPISTNGGEMAIKVEIIVVAKGVGTVTLTDNPALTINGDTETFEFVATAGNPWTRAVEYTQGNVKSYQHKCVLGSTDSIQVSASAGITDYYIMARQAPDQRSQMFSTTVEIDGYLTEGISRSEIRNDTFTVRARPTGQIPFGTVDSSQFNVNRRLSFGLGGGISGRTAGTIVFSGWYVSIVKGEAMEGSVQNSAQGPTHFQAKVPAGYVDVSYANSRVEINYYADSTPFNNSFRDFSGISPVATYYLDWVQGGQTAQAPVPAFFLNTPWSSANVWRYVITRKIGGVTHILEYENYSREALEQDKTTEVINGTVTVTNYENIYSSISYSWPWRLASAARGGLTRMESGWANHVMQYSHGGPIYTYGTSPVNVTSFLGATESSPIGDYVSYDSQYTPMTRGVGADAHSLPHQTPAGGGFQTSPVQFHNGLGGGTYTEYLSLPGLGSATDNLDGQPQIALGQPKYIRASFGDDPVLSTTDLVTDFTYYTDLVDGRARTSTAITTQDSKQVGGYSYAYTTGTFGPNSLPTLTTTTTELAAAGTPLVTTTLSYSSRIADPDLRGRTISVLHPDGTKVSYAYQRGTLSGSSWSENPAGSHFLIAELTGIAGDAVSSFGSPSPITIDSLTLDANRTTVAEKIRDSSGNIIRETTYVYAGNSTFTPLTTAYSGYDSLGQLIVTADQPIGTSGAQPGRIFYEAFYKGRQKTWERDAQGVTTYFHYNAYDQPDSVVRLGATADGTTIPSRSISYLYDALNRVRTATATGVGESDQLVSSYIYDTSGRPTSQTAPGGFTTSISYDSPTQTTTTLPGGAKRVEVVYKDGRQRSVKGSAIPDVTKTYAYDSSGNLNETTETTTGQSTVKVTDWAGRLVNTLSPTFDGPLRITTNNYNSLGQLTSQDVTGIVNGLRVKVALSTLFRYDSYGRLYREGFDADDNGILDSVADYQVKEFEEGYQTGAPGGYASNYYRYVGQKVWPYAGSNEGTSRYVSQTYTQVSGLGYATLQHIVSRDFDRNLTDTVTSLDRPNQLLTATTSTTGTNQLIVQKNLAGSVISSTNAQGQTTFNIYDGLGRLLASDDPRVGTTTMSYVPNTTLVSTVMAPDWKTTVNNYDSAGRLASQTDNAGKTAYSEYDDAGNLLYTWGDTVNPVSYKYNDLGQRTEMRTYRDTNVDWTTPSRPSGFNTGGDLTSWTYDDTTGLLKSKTDAFPRSNSFKYDATNRMRERTDARGWITSYTYYLNGLPHRVTYNDSYTTNLAYVYDRAGRLSTVSDATGTRSFNYYDTWSDNTYDNELRNKSARLKQENLPADFFGVSHSVGYDYQYSVASGAKGPLASVQIDTGTTYKVAYAYDAVGRLATASYNSVTPFTYGYVPNSNLVGTVTQITGPSTFNYRRATDYEPQSNRVLTLRHNWSTRPVSAIEGWQTYDLVGRCNTEKIGSSGYLAALGRETEMGTHQDFSYTDRSELSSSASYALTPGWDAGGMNPGTDREYDYDPIGNRISDKVAGVPGTYARNALNQYDSAPTAPAMFYDNNGNLTSDGTQTYGYDGENRLISVTNGAGSWNYVYDYLGRRVKKTGTGIELRFLYDGWNPIAELNASGNIVRQFVWGLDASGSAQGAGGVGGLLLIDNGANQYYPLYDVARNVIGLYDSVGSFAAAYEYDPFGRLQTWGGGYATDNPFRFSTKYTDTETSLTYYGYRFYSAALGRFVNRDPIEEKGGLNLYGFCGNDGVNRFDILGNNDSMDRFYAMAAEASFSSSPGTQTASTQAEEEAKKKQAEEDQKNKEAAEKARKDAENAARQEAIDKAGGLLYYFTSGAPDTSSAEKAAGDRAYAIALGLLGSIGDPKTREQARADVQAGRWDKALRDAAADATKNATNDNTPTWANAIAAALKARAARPHDPYLAAPKWLIGSPNYYVFRWYAAPKEYQDDSGPDYLFGFGLPNIYLFNASAEDASESYQNFVRNTGRELQLGLEDALDMDPSIALSRDRLLSAAYDSHEGAYRRGGFGELDLADQIKAAFVPRFSDSFFNPKAWPVYWRSRDLLRWDRVFAGPPAGTVGVSGF